MNNEFEFNMLMYSLPIEIGNKIFNYIMPSLGDHRKKMKLISVELISIQEELVDGNFLRDCNGNYARYYKSQEYQDDLYDDWLDMQKYMYEIDDD